MRLLVLADIDDIRWRGGSGQADVLVSCGDVCDQVIIQAAVAWREYRQAHAELAYSLYGDGSMRGLVFNFAFNKLTEDRLRDLQELRPEAGPGGGVE